MPLSPKIKQLATKMVQAYLDGFEVRSIGTIVHTFRRSGEGEMLMHVTDAAECREYLWSEGILMERMDSGGSPQWSFRVATK